jgi:hypothetical protein
MESPDLAIRLRRAAFNRAIADADLAAIGQFLTIIPCWWLELTARFYRAARHSL